MTPGGRGEYLSTLSLYTISELFISHRLILYIINQLLGTAGSAEMNYLPCVPLVHLKAE